MVYQHLLAFVNIVTFLAGCARAGFSYSPLPIRPVHQFPLFTYLQDVAVGVNGDIYMTTVSPGALIYSISGATTDNPVAKLVYKFENGINAATGIFETAPGIYTFLACKQGSLGVGIHGTCGVYELDTRHEEISIEELVHISDGGLVVSVFPVPGAPNTLLVSDSTLGNVYRVDTAARKYELVLHDETMVPPPWALLPFGIGCIQLHKGYLYYVESFKALIYRIPFTDDGYPAPGAKIELYVSLHTIYIESFVFADDDTIFASTNADNRVFAIKPDGNITVVAGAPDEATTLGAIAGQFGTLPGDTNTLYVVTGGGLINPINGTWFEGGKVVAVDTTSLWEDGKSAKQISSPKAKAPFKTQQADEGGVFSCGSKCVLDLFRVLFKYMVGQ